MQKNSEEASAAELNEGRDIGNRLKGAKVGARLCECFSKFSSNVSIFNALEIYFSKGLTLLSLR